MLPCAADSQIVTFALQHHKMLPCVAAHQQEGQQLRALNQVVIFV
jgi:hypothetical protein